MKDDKRFLSLCSLETLRCWDRTEADTEFSVHTYDLITGSNPGLALG